jgi:hypothetical protein
MLSSLGLLEMKPDTIVEDLAIDGVFEQIGVKYYLKIISNCSARNTPS